MKLTHILGTATLALLTSAAANAEVRINGFANLVVDRSNTDYSVQGSDDKVSFSNFSLFALQVSGDISDKLTATGQIISRGSENYSAEFEWAYLTYQHSDKLSISAGRLRLPLFLYSETLDVGYSYHWINAPQSVYDIAFNNIDGVRAVYSDYYGDWELNAQAAAGVITNTGFEGTSLRADNTALISLQLANDVFKARIVHGRATGTLNSPEVDALLPAVAQFDPVLADLLAFDEDTGIFYGASLSYDNFEWFANAEYTYNENKDTFIPTDEAMYVSAGIRLGKWTPSATYEKKNGVGAFKFLDRLNALPPPVQQGIAPIVIGTQISQSDKSETFTLGIRYDFSAGIALKGEVSRFDDKYNEDLDGTIVRAAVHYIF
ncbi:porin [Ningiella sp. W23]|uniref:porin n=1 Tax=Ningiella sp. W23 TaxID=3023715 RepID=UPI00375824A8